PRKDPYERGSWLATRVGWVVRGYQRDIVEPGRALNVAARHVAHLASQAQLAESARFGRSPGQIDLRPGLCSVDFPTQHDRHVRVVIRLDFETDPFAAGQRFRLDPAAQQVPFAGLGDEQMTGILEVDILVAVEEQAQ